MKPTFKSISIFLATLCLFDKQGNHLSYQTLLRVFQKPYWLLKQYFLDILKLLRVLFSNCYCTMLPIIWSSHQDCPTHLPRNRMTHRHRPETACDSCKTSLDFCQHSLEHSWRTPKKSFQCFQSQDECLSVPRPLMFLGPVGMRIFRGI